MLNEDPSLCNKIKENSKYKESLCYTYQFQQFDIPNGAIKYYDMKKKKILEPHEITESMYIRHAFREDMSDTSDTDSAVANVMKTKKNRKTEGLVTLDMETKITNYLNIFKEKEEELLEIDINAYYVLTEMEGLVNSSKSKTVNDYYCKISGAMEWIHANKLGETLNYFGLTITDPKKSHCFTYAQMLLEHIIKTY